MHIGRWLIVSWLLSIFTESVLAQRLPTGHAYHQRVHQQDAFERLNAFRELTMRWVQQSTASREVIHHPTLQEAYQHIEDYVAWYRYEPHSAGGYDLQVGFKTEALEQLLERLQIPWWGSKRPWLVLWIALETPEGLHWVEADNPMIPIIQQAAEQWGLPIIIPELDLETQLRLQMDEPDWGQMAQAYHTEIWGVAVLKTQAEGWEVQWQHRVGREHWKKSEQASHLSTLWEHVLHQIAQHEMHYFYQTFKKSPKEIHALCFPTPTHFRQHEQLIAHLLQIPAVQQVQITHLYPDKMRLSLSIAGGMPALVRALHLESQITLKEPLSLNAHFESAACYEANYSLF